VRLQPSELELMEFYRAEFLIENLKKHAEDENKQRKAQEEEYDKNMPQSFSASKMMNDAQRSLPKTSFKMPSGGLGSLGKLM
jgi:predicted nucleic acid-binding protein